MDSSQLRTPKKAGFHPKSKDFGCRGVAAGRLLPGLATAAQQYVFAPHQEASVRGDVPRCTAGVQVEIAGAGRWKNQRKYGEDERALRVR